jgi:uncharacterized membrane protein
MNAPIKFSPKTEIVPIFFVVASFLLGIFFYTRFPAQVISHWSFAGVADGYSDKLSGAFALPLIIAAMYLLFLVLPFFDPKKERYGEFQHTYHIFRLVLMAVMFGVYMVMGLVNLGYPVNVQLVVPVMIGLLMMIIGNFMGKLKPNWFMGIRTPWTLSSDTVWQKTHRVGGYLFVLFGLIVMMCPFLGPIAGGVLFGGGVTLLVLGTFVYSFIAYRQEKPKKE